MARMKSLISALNDYTYNVENISSKENEYNLIKLFDYKKDNLYTDCHFYQTNTLYIIRASQLHKIINLSSDGISVGFFIIHDKDYHLNLDEHIEIVDFAKNTDEYQLLKDTAKIMNSFNKIDNAKKEISESLMSNSDLQTLLEVTSSYIDNPIMLFNLSTNILATSKKEILMEKADDAVIENFKKGYNSYGVFKEYKILELVSKVKQSETPFIHVRKGEKTQRLLFRVQVDNKMVGFLSVQGLIRDFNNEDLLIIQYLSKALSIKLKISPYEFDFNGDANENILIELIENQYKSFNVLKERTKPFNWKLKSDFFVLTITHKANSKPENEANLQTLRRYLFDLLPFISVYYEGKLSVLISQDEDVALSDEMLSNIIMLLEENDLIAGLSSSFKNILELHEYYSQSLKMIELGLLLQSSDSLYIFDDFYVNNLLFELYKVVDLKKFCLPQIYQLQQYDSELFFTLAVYLKSGQNMNQAHNKLYIHINTLRNRLHKISNIIDMDLENGKNCTKLYISILILEMLEQIEKAK